MTTKVVTDYLSSNWKKMINIWPHLKFFRPLLLRLFWVGYGPVMFESTDDNYLRISK